MELIIDVIDFLNLYQTFKNTEEEENGVFFGIKSKEESIDLEDDIISFN